MESYTAGNNYLWINLERYALDIGVVYKPGHTNFSEFLVTYQPQLLQRRRAIVSGDTNIDLLTPDSKTKAYKNLLRESGYKLVNKIDPNYCTRESPTTKTIIDHVATNLNDNKFHFAVIDSALSDYKNIYVELKKFKPPRKQKTRYVVINYKNLYKGIETSNFNNDDCNFDALEKFIKEKISENKEVKYRLANLPQTEWINKKITTGIDKRNQLWCKLKQDLENNEIKAEYDGEKRRVAELIKTSKRNYYYGKFQKCVNKPKNMWNVIKSLSLNKPTINCAPPKLATDANLIISDPTSICETFNDFFANIGKQLASKIAPSYHHNAEVTLPKQNISTKHNKLSNFLECDVKEVSDIIDNLDPNCSLGIDYISTKVIKCIKDLVVHNLTGCLNNLLREGVFPDSLKMAKVSPIHKSGSKSNPGNYRPISVLPVLSKILEKVVYRRLDAYLAEIDFLFEHQ
jgi:hypothetical protein